jgi:hypothetical protein
MKINTSSPKIQAEPFHIILFTFLPALILVTNNVSEVDLKSTYRLLGLSLAVGLVIFAIMFLGVKSRQRAAIIVSFLIIVFCSYGNVYNALRDGFPQYLTLIRHRYLYPIVIVATGVVVYLLIKKIPAKNLPGINSALNLIGLVMVVYNIAMITSFQIQQATKYNALSANQASNNQKSRPLPDIYFIVLDSYARADVLKSYFKFDNSPFIKELNDLGFYVPECSQSNYNFTIASVSTTLNMDYLGKFNLPIPANTHNTISYINHYQNSIVKQRLQSAGYKIISSESEYPWLEWKDADVYFNLPSQNGVAENLQPFELLYLQGTGLRFFIDNNPQADIISNKEVKYRIGSYQLAQLKTVSQKVASPKFLFIDLEVTHPPFVFNTDGSLNTETGFSDNIKDTNYPQFQADYVNSIKFINGQMLDIVKTILANSKVPPIIFIQGDHGFRAPEYTNMNFEAFLVPGGEKYLYPTISPVNNFRVVENVVFDNPLPMLPDLHYRRIGNDYYHFDQFTETMPGCVKK